MEALFFIMKKTNIYIDGLNLYHNSLQKKQLYWLDIQSFVERSLENLIRKNNLLEKYSINQIKFFTAPVKSQGSEFNLKVRQQLYIKAPSYSTKYRGYYRFERSFSFF